MKRPFSIILLVALLVSCGGGGGGGSGPTVASTNATEKVFTTDGITVTFSKSMNEESVEDAFLIEGSGAVDGTFSWSEDTVTFTPTSRWKTHHAYTLTISTNAKSSDGNRLREEFTQTFTPELNMYDVNGDRIDDFLAGAPLHTAGGLYAGIAYLFLGRTDWPSTINLSRDSADATYAPEGNMEFGLDAKMIGDFNGDGYADMVISAPSAELDGDDFKGFVVVVFGSADPRSIEITAANLDKLDGIMVGMEARSHLGLPIMPVGDVNGDGLADFVLGGGLPPNDSRFWLILGRTTPLPDPTLYPRVNESSSAAYSVTGDEELAEFPVAGCDVNGDELDDLVFGSPEASAGGTKRGEVLVVAGSDDPETLDLRTAGTADMTIKGANDNDRLGLSVACGDINDDGYGDIIAGAAGYHSTLGRAYVVLGSEEFRDINFATEAADATITGKRTDSLFSSSICVQGKVNDNKFNTMLIGAMLETADGINHRGVMRAFYGSSDPQSINLARVDADVTYLGPDDTSLLSYCKPAGDINGDGIEDILIGAPLADGGGMERGKVYIIFGSESLVDINFDTGSPDVLITGSANGDHLAIRPFAI
jgi:hypothetical protein